MANLHSKPWRVLAARAMVHLGTARLLLDLALDSEPPEALAGKLRSVEGEVTAAQDLVRSVAEVTS
jgi:hypothetical protein